MFSHVRDDRGRLHWMVGVVDDDDNDDDDDGEDDGKSSSRNDGSEDGEFRQDSRRRARKGDSKKSTSGEGQTNGLGAKTGLWVDWTWRNEEDVSRVFT